MSRYTFARFSYDQGRVNQNRVHWRLFKPPRNDRLSIFSVDELSAGDISELGEKEGQQRADNTREVQHLYGWALLGIAAITGLSLKLHPDNSHVNVTGWSDNEVDRKDKSQKLARSSIPVVLSDPVRITPQ